MDGPQSRFVVFSPPGRRYDLPPEHDSACEYSRTHHDRLRWERIGVQEIRRALHGKSACKTCPWPSGYLSAEGTQSELSLG